MRLMIGVGFDCDPCHSNDSACSGEGIPAWEIVLPWLFASARALGHLKRFTEKSRLHNSLVRKTRVCKGCLFSLSLLALQKMGEMAQTN